MCMLSFAYDSVLLEENLEAKMMWLKNFERIQEIQQQVIWQPITETEPRAFIPEVYVLISAVHKVRITNTNVLYQIKFNFVVQHNISIRCCTPRVQTILS